MKELLQNKERTAAAAKTSSQAPAVVTRTQAIAADIRDRNQTFTLEHTHRTLVSTKAHLDSN